MHCMAVLDHYSLTRVSAPEGEHRVFCPALGTVFMTTEGALFSAPGATLNESAPEWMLLDGLMIAAISEEYPGLIEDVRRAFRSQN